MATADQLVQLIAELKADRDTAKEVAAKYRDERDAARAELAAAASPPAPSHAAGEDPIGPGVYADFTPISLTAKRLTFAPLDPRQRLAAACAAVCPALGAVRSVRVTGENGSAFVTFPAEGASKRVASLLGDECDEVG